MSGINLSQSLHAKQEEARGRFFDTSLLISLGGFVLLLGVFGGLHWYAGSLTKRMQALDQTIAQKTATLRGKEVNRVADFAYRQSLIGEHLSQEPDPVVALRQLEAATLSSVRLNLYAYDRKEATLKIGGMAGNLKEVAQQMLAFKHMEEVERVTVDKIDYDVNGKIQFVFVLQRPKALPAQ